MASMTTPPDRVGWMALTGAHIRRDWFTAWSYRLPFLAGLFTSIASLLLYFFIAKLVDRAQFDDTPELANGYFGFVVVGSSLVSIMSVGISVSAARLTRAQSTGTLEAMAVTPVPLWATTFLGTMYDLLYATASGIVTMAAAVVFFGVRLDVAPEAIILIVAALIATFMLFASVGLLVSAFGLVFKRTGPLLALVNTGLTFLGGVFFPVDVLPGPVRIVAEAMPFTWAIDVLRLSLLAGAVPVGRLIALVLSALVVFPLAILVFSHAVNRTRKAGTLGQY